jgi:acetyl-CoA C-acetyltransferase
MWDLVARAAAADAGTGSDGRVRERIDLIDVVYCQSWDYDDPAGRLATRIGATRARGHYSGIGGSIPQTLLSEAAADILAGELDLVLVVGGEALATVRQIRKEGRRPDWSHKAPERRPFPFDIPFHPAEMAHSIFEAYLTFSLFDSARRAHLGRALDDHQAWLGRLMAPMTVAAAADPTHAWFPIRRDAEELSTPTAANRMVAYPYTKLMMAIMDVDMAAALLLASHECADELGVPPEQRVYLRGWGNARDPDYVAEHRDLWRSPAMAVAARAALAGAGIRTEDVTHFDLYSCFPSSVAFGADALGLDLDMVTDGARPLTVTGGLPYHGGPGSNYMTHSIAAMAERLRSDAGAFGLVSGVGMHMTKHAYGLWSTQPGRLSPPDPRAMAQDLDRERDRTPALEPGPAGVLEPATDPEGRVTITVEADGPAAVAAYTVLHDREGSATWAPLVCNLADGTRCYARADDPGMLAAAEREELIGQTVHLVVREGVNHAQA